MSLGLLEMSVEKDLMVSFIVPHSAFTELDGEPNLDSKTPKKDATQIGADRLNFPSK